MKIVNPTQHKITTPSDIGTLQHELLGQYNVTFANLEHADYANYAARARRLQGEAFKAFFSGLWAAFSHYAQVRRIENQLSRLSDRGLNDIGLSREQIFAAASGAYTPQSDHILSRAANSGIATKTVLEVTKVAA